MTHLLSVDLAYHALRSTEESFLLTDEITRGDEIKRGDLTCISFLRFFPVSNSGLGFQGLELGPRALNFGFFDLEVFVLRISVQGLGCSV
jgi:hypothetical protein